jgi:hypothetical protein
MHLRRGAGDWAARAPPNAEEILGNLLRPTSAGRSLRRTRTAERQSALDQSEEQRDEGHPDWPFRTGPVAGQSRARTRPGSSRPACAVRDQDLSMPQRWFPGAPPPHRRRAVPARAGSSGARGAKRRSEPLAAGGPVCAPLWRRRGGGRADAHLRARVPERSDAFRARACRVAVAGEAGQGEVGELAASEPTLGVAAGQEQRAQQVGWSAPCRWR